MIVLQCIYGTNSSTYLTWTIDGLVMDYGDMVSVCVICACACVGCGIVWLILLRFCAELFIYIAFALVICTTGICGSMLIYEASQPNQYFSSGSDTQIWCYAIGIALCVLSVLAICYCCCIRHRIALTAAIIGVVVDVIAMCPMIMVTAFLAVFCKVLYLMLCVLCLWSALDYGDNANFTTGQYFGLYTFLIFMSLWGIIILRDIVRVSAAGIIGQWYFHSDNYNPSACLALWRTLTTSSGSVCLGAFLVAVMDTIRIIADYFLRKDCPGWVQCCVDCILACIQGCIDFISNMALCVVGVHGCSFCEGARKAFGSGDTAVGTLIQNSLIEPLEWTGCIAGTLVSVVIPVYFLHQGGELGLEDDSMAWAVGAIFCFVCFFMLHAMMVPLSAGAMALYFCMVEDIGCLETRHPKQREELLRPWEQIHGSHGTHGGNRGFSDDCKIGDDGRMVKLSRRSPDYAAGGAVTASV